MTGNTSGRGILRYTFLLLLPVFFVLHGFNEHYPVIPVADSIILAGQFFLATLVLMMLFYFLLRSWNKAALLSFLLMTVFLFFGPFHDFLKHLSPHGFPSKYIFLLPFLLVLFSVVFLWLRKTSMNFKKTFRYLFVLFGLLCVMELAELVYHSSQRKKSKAVLSFRGCNSCDEPDVYLIIADEYAGMKELEQVLGFDNSSFANQLKARGFFIADSSVSNYNYTPFSVASLLKMNYLAGLEGKNKSRKDQQLSYETINDNPVLDFFESKGYTLKNYSVFCVHDRAPLVTTSFYKSGADLITAHTLLGRMNRDIRFNLVTRFKIKSELEKVSYHERKLNEVLYEKTLKEVKSASHGPRFVYTHLEMPHYPYYFDKNGKPYPLEGLLDDANLFNRDRYLQYLQYGNTLLLQLVDQILSHSSKPPVILLMGDHGFREFRDEEAVDHKYHFMNLNAVLLPGKNYMGFYKGISIVNQFRVVLNTEFGQQLPILSDSSIYLTE